MSVSYDFTGQVALVTGAAQGMGFDTAQAFAEAGAAVVLSDINQEVLQRAVSRLEQAGHRVLGVVCDVADEAQVESLIQQTVAAFGRLAMAFHHAGLPVPPCQTAELPASDFDLVNAVNLRGVWACMKHELRQMTAQGTGGAIVNCSSVGGLVGLPTLAAYHASKHGVLGLTKSAGLEYAAQGIRINAVCPGTIDTPMVSKMLKEQPETMAEVMKKQMIGRLGRGDEIAAAVLWLCSPWASFVIGHALAVDGGFTAN